MKKISLFILTGFTLCLSACTPTVHSTMQTNSQNLYTITSQSNDGLDALRASMNKSADFCAKKHLRVIAMTIDSDYKSVDLPKNYTYHATINFECAAPL